MQRELPVKQDDFSRLLTREAFLWNYFNCRLNYRIREYLLDFYGTTVS